VNARTREEWRALGFHYDRDDAARRWRLAGSRAGLSAFLAAALATACASGPPPSAVRPDDPAGAIADADRPMSAAVGAGDEAAFRAFLDPATAWVGSRGAFAEGPDAVVRAWARFLAPGGPTISWEPEVARVAASGDLGYSLGAASITSEGRVAWEGRYATVWRRDASGRFLVVLDMSDADPAPLAALARETTRPRPGRRLADRDRHRRARAVRLTPTRRAASRPRGRARAAASRP
jgi:ketosteroid isomerase-like protein